MCRKLPLLYGNQKTLKLGKWIDLVEWWYYTTFHSAIQTTPFKALYHYDPPHFTNSSTKTPVVDNFIKDRRIMTELLRENISKAQARCKQFDVGKEFRNWNLVYLKKQPCRQTSLSLQKNLLLHSKYFGPFEVVQKIENVNQKLALLGGSIIHLVFHFSLLKRRIGPNYTPITELPTIGTERNIILEPIAILDLRLVKSSNLLVAQVPI